MQDFVIVSEGLEEKFILRAKELGYDSLILLYKYSKGAKLPSFSSDFVKTGWFLDANVEKDFSGYEIVVALGTKFIRLPKGVSHVVMNEFEPEKDFIHQRRSGLNHVFLNDFKGKVLFAFSSLQNLNLERQSQIIGRFMQNVNLTSNWSVVSLASDVSEMRDYFDVKAFS
ncbi:MAG: hypothetical protein AB7V77_05785, partial [Candidatus Woesearchaeota archaeon]